MKKSLLIVVVIFSAVVLLVTVFAKPPVIENPEEKLEFVIKEKQNDRLDLIYLNLIDKDSLNIDYHYGFIINHFSIVPQNRIIKDDVLSDIYWEYCESDQEIISDIGFYCLGLIASIQKDYNDALVHFIQINNDNLKYLNNSLGRVYEDIGDYTEAETYYKREINNRGNLEGAYSNLISLYQSQDRVDDLKILLKTKESRKYFPSQLKRFLFLTSLNVFGYFEAVFSHTYQNMNWVGFLGALFVMLSWLFYLRRIDIYEPEKWKYILFIFVLGVVFSEFTFLLSDLNTLFTGFSINGRVLNDLLYCIIGIGVIEELVKILPVFIVLKYTRAINEPVDYLLYASVSALGFAFAENLLYFNSYGPQIIMGRALTAVVFHMFLSSLAAYGLMLKKYRSRKTVISDFTRFFILAAIIHGLYDFWLINQAVSQFGILSMVILVFCFAMYNTLLSNALSNSEFYDERIHLNRKKLQNYLIYSLSAILLFQYLVISVKFGAESGWESLKSSLLSGGYLIIFISANLGTISIKHRRWQPLRFKLPRFSFKLEYDPKDIIGKEFEINSVSKNRDINRLFPNKGKIIRQETVSDNTNWYLVELDKAKEILEYNGRYILVKAKNPKHPIKEKKTTEVAVFVFITDEKIFVDQKLREDFLFVGWVKMKLAK